MRMIRLISFCALIISVSTACNQPTVEEEVDDICECIKSAENESDMDDCEQMMERITDKYAFDPEAADDIKKRLSECAPE
ncbi:MAG: hypothetical protein ACFHU9_15465 [Fluviicola sp.]